MCDVFSLSRGGMLMFLMASGFSVGASIVRKPTGRKIGLVAAGALVGLGGVIKAWDTIVNRFLHAPKESEEARVLFNKAAALMASDHPFGVGINMYSHVLEHGGYAARLNIDPGDRNGIAHHIYWLTTAETGYVGAATFVLLLAVVLGNAARSMGKPDGRGDLAVGLVAGLTVTYTQGTAEWIGRQTNMSYLFWLFAAIGVALRHLPPLGVPKK
jgi:O-antigen ligase